MTRSKEDKLTCAFCSEIIEEEDEVYSVGVKIKKEFNFLLKDQEARMIKLPFGNMILPAILVAPNSEAKREGYDLSFSACSYNCAQKLRDLLEAEKDFAEKIQSIE